MRYEMVNEVAASPEQLWPWLTEPERMKQWMKGLLEIVPDGPEPVAPGATFKMRIKEGRKVAEYDEEMQVFEPFRHLRIRLTGGSFGTMSFFAENELHDIGGGRTRLVYRGWTEGGPWWCTLLAPIGKLFMSIQSRGFHRKLKELAESEARAPRARIARA